MATTKLDSHIPIDVIQSNFDGVHDRPVFSGDSRSGDISGSTADLSTTDGRPKADHPEVGENDPELHPLSGEGFLDAMLMDLSYGPCAEADGFGEFVNHPARSIADRLLKSSTAWKLRDIDDSDMTPQEKLVAASDIIAKWKKRISDRSSPEVEAPQVSEGDPMNDVLESLDNLNLTLGRTSNSKRSSDSDKVSVLSLQNLRDLGLEDDRVRHPKSSVESDGYRTTGDDVFWSRVERVSSKSSSTKNGQQGGSGHRSNDEGVQPPKWSDSQKSEVQQVLSLLPPQTSEQKELGAKLLRRMKFARADRLFKSYLSQYYRDRIFPTLEEVKIETLCLLVEDIIPGYQQYSEAFKNLCRSCLPQDDPSSPRTPTHPKQNHAKGGNSGQKFKGFRLNHSSAEDSPPLPPVSGDNRTLEAKVEPQNHESAAGSPSLSQNKGVLESKDSEDLCLEDLLKEKESALLPKYMKFRKGDKVVIATLHSNDEKPVSDHAIKDQTATYLLEPYVVYKKKMIPWSDLDPDFPSRPFEVNAAHLVDLAGRRWAGREDLEQKRSLLASGYESCYHVSYVDKLNLTRDNLIKVLDVVLGDKTKGKVYEPEPIPCVSSTYQSNMPAMRAKIWVKRNYERTLRAYSLLNLNVKHFIFPITSDELKSAIIKRTSNHRNKSSWRKFHKRIVEVCHSLMFDTESVDDVKPGDFLAYARDMISRKGLSEGESMPLFAAAKYAEFLLENDGSNERMLSMLTYCLEKETKVFVKNEEYEKTDTTNRFIVSPHAFVKIVFGTVFRPVEEKLYFDDRSPLAKHLIKGKTQEEVKDMLTSMPKKKNEVYCETDSKAFESSQDEHTLKWEYRIYRSFYKADSLANAIITRVQECNCRPGWLYNKYFRILRNAMRLSGLNTTACGNALWNYINLVAVCGVDPDSVFYIEGDDAILVLAISVALKMTEISLFPLTFLMADKWSDLSFCGHHYDLDGQRIISYESLVRKLTTYFSANPINRRKAYELLYLRLLSFQLSYPGNPYLDDLIDEVNREYDDVRSCGVREKTVRQWYKENWWRFDGLIGQLKLPADRSMVPSFHKMYDSLITKIDQAGEILTPSRKVDLANYCLHENFQSRGSNIGNFALMLMAAGCKFMRRLSGHRSRAPENSLVPRPMPSHEASDEKEERRARAHDSCVDYLNQFSWYRKLASTTKWRFLKYTSRAAVGPQNEYFPDADFELVLCTRAYNHEWHKLMRLDDLAFHGPLGPGRASGMRAL